MEETEVNPFKEVPTPNLKSVPIDEQYVKLMTSILTKHGAMLKETNEPAPATVEGTTRMFEVSFPPGTTRSFGLVMARSVPFVISFPDNYYMNGAELWPIQRHEADTCINVLYLEKDEVAKEQLLLADVPRTTSC